MTTSAKIESLLFITGRPLSVTQLAKATGSTLKVVEEALRELTALYNQPNRGVSLQRIGSQVQLATTGQTAAVVKAFVREELTGELTRPALETLTIIAYRGPVSRAELEQIRGVNCAVILRHLLLRGLVAREEKAGQAGRAPETYSITFELLKFLGLRNQSELPDYEQLRSVEQLDRLAKSGDQVSPA